jgi:ribonuclease Z
MSEYVQLVGTDVPDSVGSCCLVADERRILFNCPEGSQRAMSEGRLRIGKVSTFLFTRVETSSVMGLPGFLFSVNDCGLRRCVVGGPLDELLKILETTWRCFFGFRTLTCELPNYSDPLSLSPAPAPVRVEGGFKLAAKSSAPAAQSPIEVAAAAPLPTVVFNVTCNPKEWYRTPGTLLFRVSAGVVDVIAFFVGISTAPSLRSTPTPIVGYILLEREKVVFDAAAAKAMGVKPGPKFAKLKTGVDVESDTVPPIMIKATDVTRVQPGSVFSLIVDTDDAAMLHTALQNLFTLPMFASKPLSKAPTLQHVFHLASPSITCSVSYQSTINNSSWWASQYPVLVPNESALEHANSSAQRGFTGFPTALVHRMHLKALAPLFFPFPSEYVDAEGVEKVVMWPYANRFRLGAASKKPPGSPPPPDELIVRYPDSAMATAMLSETFRSEYLGASTSASCIAGSDVASCGDITFLGTGSSIPSKYRNVSGIIVKLPRCGRDDAGGDETRVVLDCGEGTVGQLFSQCVYPTLGGGASSIEGVCQFESIMSSIDVVFISHSHADHNLGLFSMIEHMVGARRRRPDATKLTTRPLVIVAPADFLEFVDRVGLIDIPTLQREENLQLDAFSSNGPMLPRCPVRGGAAATCHHHAAHPPPTLRQLPGLQSWCERRGYAADVFPVDHPAHAHGIVFQKKRPACTVRREDNEAKNDEPFAVLYSGDTRPNELLIERGRQFGPLDVLIHEATFDDSLAAEAKHKNHSTTGEAIEVARRCSAKTVLLTHFSQRYPKLPPPSASANCTRSVVNCNEPRVVFAFDYMRIPIQRALLEQLSALTPAFVALLAEYDSWESGTSKRLREDV